MVTIFENALIIDGLGGLIEKGWVWVEDERIRAVDGTGNPPPNTIGEMIDLEGRVLMPGLIDCHVHLVLDCSPDPAKKLLTLTEADAALHMASHAAHTLQSGVTTVRDLGCYRHVGLSVRNAVNAGIVQGPTMLCAGNMICMTGGHGWQIGLEADGPDAVRKAVRSEVKAGADVIKLMATGGICTEGVEPGHAQLTLEELRAGIEEAHKAGRRTSAHAQGLQGVKNALFAGIDTIEHGMQLDDDAIEAMLKHEVYLVPTLSAGANMIARGTEAGIPAFMVEKSKEHRQSRLSSFVKAWKAGVRIAFGTDAGTPFNMHGRNASELSELVAMGLSSHEAIVSATGRAAEALGIQHATGSILPGKQADLLILEKNPLEDIHVLLQRENVYAVYKKGRRVAMAIRDDPRG
jgi:imidazolonepropionase-like amidohydrolase